MTKTNSIAKNTSFFTLALIIQKVITFTYFILLARYLGPDDLGKYYLAISFSSIFLTIIDLGQANLLTREVAKQRAFCHPDERSEEGSLRQGQIDRQDFSTSNVEGIPHPCGVRNDRRDGVRNDKTEINGFSDVHNTQNKLRSIIGPIMAIKLPLIFLSALIVVVLANVMNYPALTKTLIYYSIALMIMDSLATTFFAIIRGHHNLKYESMNSITSQLIILVLGFVFLKLGLGLISLMIVQIIGTASRFGTSLWAVVWKFKISLRPDFDRVKIKSILVLTVPFAMYAVYNKLYLYLDTVLLSKLAGDFETGLYQIAFKFIFALQFLPLAFVASLYPAFASAWKDTKNNQTENNDTSPVISTNVPPVISTNVSPVISTSEARRDPFDVVIAEKIIPQSNHVEAISFPRPRERNDRSENGVRNDRRRDEIVSPLTVTFERALNYLSLIALPITFGIFAIAPELINFFKPEYAAGVWPLRISILALIFIFLNYPVGSLLNACDRQKANTRNMGIVMGLSIIANIILIPRYQALGASFTVLATNIIMFILGFYYVPKIIEVRIKKILWPFLKAFFASITMVLFAVFFKTHMNLFLAIALSGLVYSIMIFTSGAIKLADLRSVAKSFVKK